MSFPSSLRSADAREINEGDEVRLLSLSSQTNTLSITNGHVYNKPTEAGRFMIGVTRSNNLSSAIVTDKKNRVLVVVVQNAPAVQAMDIGAIQALLKR